jgi:VIT1/CCC1 family predicted Fe2+/Mn2+ transporter
MGTKTVDEAANEATEVKSDAETVDVTKTDEEVTEQEAANTEAEAAEDEDDLSEEEYAAELAKLQLEHPEEGPTGVGQGAAAVVSAALGFISLSGGWIGSVAAARETLVGQLHTASTASVATQIKEVYGDAWHTTALWAGIFALVGALVGVATLVRPAFGTPGKPQATWIKSVAWAGVALGVVGLLLAVLKYTDVLLSLPSAS